MISSLDLLQGIAILAVGIATALQMHTVRGSYLHYVATSWAITGEVATVVISLVQIGVGTASGNTTRTGVGIFFALLYAIFAWWDITQNDNWFNTRRKRLRRWLRELRKRLSQNPLPSPAA